MWETFSVLPVSTASPHFQRRTVVAPLLFLGSSTDVDLSWADTEEASVLLLVRLRCSIPRTCLALPTREESPPGNFRPCPPLLLCTQIISLQTKLVLEIPRMESLCFRVAVVWKPTSTLTFVAIHANTRSLILAQCDWQSLPPARD